MKSFTALVPRNTIHISEIVSGIDDFSASPKVCMVRSGMAPIRSKKSFRAAHRRGRRTAPRPGNGNGDSELRVLADGAKHVCVYCDWHDDYVAEIGSPPTRYVFHQVKGVSRRKDHGSLASFFGVLKKRAAKPSKQPAAFTANAIAPLMLLHHKNFGDSCAGLAFVTNAGLDPALSQFLETVAHSSTESDLPAEDRMRFNTSTAHTWLANPPPLMKA